MNAPLQGLEEQIVRQRQEGSSVKDIALRYRVSRQAIYDVLKKAEKEGKDIPWERRVKTPKPCQICGKPFLPKIRKNKTCSPACAKALMSLLQRKPGSKWSRHDTLELTCHRCGKKFTRTRYQQSISMVRCAKDKKDFCGRECYREHLTES